MWNFSGHCIPNLLLQGFQLSVVKWWLSIGTRADSHISYCESRAMWLILLVEFLWYSALFLEADTVAVYQLGPKLYSCSYSGTYFLLIEELFPYHSRRHVKCAYVCYCALRLKCDLTSHRIIWCRKIFLHSYHFYNDKNTGEKPSHNHFGRS